MDRLMLDANVVDALADHDFLNMLSSYEVFITQVQKHEIDMIPDSARRKQRIDTLEANGASVLPSFFGYGKDYLGFGGHWITKDEMSLEESLQGNKHGDNRKDSLIGVLAIKYNCTLLTNDRRFANSCRANGVTVMSVDEFKEWHKSKT